jgi:flagellar basal-body rod protein FlgF
VENGLLIGLSRQATLERQLDVVANNIANANTTGFKSTNSIFQEFLSQGARDRTFSTADAPIHFVFDREAWHDFSQGPIVQTGNPLDIALDGQGFIAVQTQGGERYTRNGALKINADGQLVTADGATVEGTNNGPITLQATDRKISVAADGRISVVEGANGSVDTVRGQIKLVSFANPQQLTSEGASTFSAPAGVAPQTPTNLRVVQGAIEGSNVNAVAEMTRMIEISRTYSMIASLMQSRDDERRNSIDKLAAVPN